MVNCPGVPEVIYNFNIQGLISFEDSENFYAKGLLPFTSILKGQLQQIIALILNRKLFVVSYIMIVAFHPGLKLDKIIIQKSYVHTIEQLTSLEYFSQDQIKCIKEL